MFRTILLSLVALLGGASAPAAGLGAGAWRLESIDAEPFALTATLQIGADGRISGAAPCNRWFARGPGLDGALLGPIGSTKRACDGLDDELRFLGLLAVMTDAQASADRLVLTGEGHEMVFVPLVE